jgi:hypothetical protein
MAPVQEHVASIDLIVFVPIEEPDRIVVPRSQAALRAHVDEVLRDIIVDDAYGLENNVIVAAGVPAARLRQVVTHIRSTSR